MDWLVTIDKALADKIAAIKTRKEMLDAVKKEEAAIQDAGRNITDCALKDMKKNLEATRKKNTKDKDCQ